MASKAKKSSKPVARGAKSASAAKKAPTAKAKKAKAAPVKAKKPVAKKVAAKKPSKPIAKNSKNTKAKPVNKVAAKAKPVKKASAPIKAPVKKKVAPAKVAASVKPVQVKPAVKAMPKTAPKVITKPKVSKPKVAANDRTDFIEVGTSAIEIPAEIPPYQEEAGEEYMNKKQHEHFRNLLLQRKKEFMDEMERTVHHLQDEGSKFADPNDSASYAEQFSVELRARDRELKYIKNIEDALRRLDEGEYGYCEACGVEIGVRRLEARPTATLCIDCKTLDEIREKQMGG